ncbi:hypothetical protein K1W54_28845 [Micromonospora sp. CPCC 205371]|nr:hypothetical protein [Micromonospora sp. CPCC 205371]
MSSLPIERAAPPDPGPLPPFPWEPVITAALFPLWFAALLIIAEVRG